jgi:hypothetical protein
MPTIIKIIFALMNVGFGVLSIVRPDAIAKVSGFTLNSPVGRSELRVAFGGVFLGVGLGAILLGDDAAYQLLGIGYMFAFITRLVSLVLDGSTILRRDYYVFGAFELVSAIVFLL